MRTQVCLREMKNKSSLGKSNSNRSGDVICLLQLFLTSIFRKAVDTETASKSFDLKLAEFGPYTCSYTRNGRHLVLGGRSLFSSQSSILSTSLKKN